MLQPLIHAHLLVKVSRIRKMEQTVFSLIFKDCIFTDFQRLVELCELIGTEMDWMTEGLCRGWLNVWGYGGTHGSKKAATEAKKMFPDKDTECQYYICMYKLAMDIKEKSKLLISLPVIQKLRYHLLNPSQKLTSTGLLIFGYYFLKYYIIY